MNIKQDFSIDLNFVKGETKMKRKYEYMFVRLGEGTFGITAERHTYHEVIKEHVEEGWRLVQIFAPSIGGFGMARFYEVILEREVAP